MRRQLLSTIGLRAELSRRDARSTRVESTRTVEVRRTSGRRGPKRSDADAEPPPRKWRRADVAGCRWLALTAATKSLDTVPAPVPSSSLAVRPVCIASPLVRQTRPAVRAARLAGSGRSIWSSLSGTSDARRVRNTATALAPAAKVAPRFTPESRATGLAPSTSDFDPSSGRGPLWPGRGRGRRRGDASGGATGERGAPSLLRRRARLR